MAKEKTYSTKERKEMVTIKLFERDKSIVLTGLTQDNQDTEVRCSPVKYPTTEPTSIFQ